MLLNTNAKIHPNVLFIIVDAYERRAPDQHRAIGSLLGTNDNGNIEITNAFCVPHSESDEEVAVELDFAQDMYDLHHKVSPNEVIVGWFSTGSDIIDHSLLIHEYYKRVVENPIHITVDTDLAAGKLDYKCYCSVPIGLPSKQTPTMFVRVPIQLTASNAELVGIHTSFRSMRQLNRQVEPQSDLHSISDASASMEENINMLIPYVNQVLDNEEKPDPKVGRELMRILNCIPKMTPQRFQEMHNTNIRDQLMVTFLSTLNKVNVDINEKVMQYVGANLAKETGTSH